MKILLIYPHFLEDRLQSDDIQAPPMGIYWVGAVLQEKGYEVEILNWHSIHKTPEKIRETLQEKKPHVIGFSILHANRWGGIEIAGIAKQLDPGVKIVFGGIGATFLWEHLLTHFPEIDAVVLGEGEHPFLNLVRHFEKGGATYPEHISGIAFRKAEKIIKTKDSEPVASLDELPMPARYFEYQHVSSTRGCAWKCRFCGSPRFWGGRIRFRSPEHFVEELEILYNKGISFFYVSDDAFTVKKARVIKICKRILERNLSISWYAISRVDCVDEEILYWMRMAGCIQISYGIESGSEKIRDLLNKGITTDQAGRAFALTTRYGILPRAYFIYGSPGETRETIEESVNLIHRIKPLSAIFYILDLFPGTELYEALKQRDHLNDDIWLNRIEGLMYLETDPCLSDELVLSFGKRLRSAFYENIHAFVESISLVDRKELYGMHADFCSRLAMTFTHGDYSRKEAIRDKDKTAEKLFKKALGYFPHERAFLGLGIMKQKNGDYEASIRVLSEGVEHFPHSEELNICLGVSLMNAGDYRQALSRFRKFQGSRQAAEYARQCEQALA